MPPVSHTDAATLVTFTHNGEVWIYDVGSNKASMLVDAGMECGYWFTKFVNRRTVAFINSSDLFFLDMPTGSVHKVKTFVPSADRLNDYLQDYAVDQSASTLAVLGTDTKPGFALAVSSLKTGKLLFSKRLGRLCGCDGGGAEPEVYWSSDGSLLLVIVTNDQNQGLISVFDRAGKNVISPFLGANARWLGSTKTILYQQDSGPWNTYDVATRKTALWLDERNLTYPVVSPDGTKVAFTDNVALRVVVVNVATKAEQAISGLHAFPLWLSNDRLAVSAVRRCTCGESFWETTGTVGSVSLSTGKTLRMTLTESFDAAVLY